ncbi:MAG: serine/threonine-protein kinase [Anaerolineae bacterium]|jgi:serine/threonine protein kinase|nr:serine/threonine-protein kinase [Anaerolineae bacterium]
MIGRMLGKYQIIEPLGEGGMATVYKAFDPGLERYVAVKVIRAVSQIDPNFLSRFQREARALAKLDHPYILKVLDYGEQDGVPYLVMPYVANGTLHKYARKRIPYTQAIKLIIPIAEALGYAHAHKIIHRDIKPANILFGESGAPVLSDFGIAKMIDGGDQTQLTGTGIGIGTPDYMAPEQWNGLADERTDVYALGIVLYELITGRTPFHADTPAAILLKQVQEPLPRPRSYVPDLPEAVENLLFKALAKDPNLRYQNMDAFAAAMQKVLRNEFIEFEGETLSVDAGQKPPPMGATVVAPVEENKKEKKKKWLPWAIGGVVLTGACLVIAIIIALTQFDLFQSKSSTETPGVIAALNTQENDQSPTNSPIAATSAPENTITTEPTQPQSVDTIEQLPEDIPVFTPNNGDVITTTSQGTITFSYSTAVDHVEVETFFKDQLVELGWELVSESDMPAQGMMVLAFMKEDRYVTITISSVQEGVTYIMLIPG